MPYCINCGSKNEADATFCLSCGQPLYRTHRRKIAKASLAVLGLSAIVILCAGIVVMSLNRSPHLNPNPLPQTAPIPQAKSLSTDAVLTIIAFDAHEKPGRQGSGFILTPDGLAGSNFHVLKNASGAVAECCGGRKFLVSTVEAVDAERDLVTFQLSDPNTGSNPRNLPVVAINGSGTRTIGEKLVAIGSPQGLEDSVSDGVLSAVRNYRSTRYLQITAPISPGSSGGPVLDANGDMIGIATMQLTAGQNLNFAVDAEQLLPLLSQRLGLPLAQLGTTKRAAREGGVTPETGPEGVSRPETQLTGWFLGQVHNSTVAVDAGFAIAVTDTDGKLSGCMGVLRPLAGSGPLAGFESGPDVQFAVTSDLGTITFNGRRAGGRISGTYVVQHPNGSNEEGSFFLEREKGKPIKGELDPESCPTDANLNDNQN